ncbi:MAG: hypothetical protein A2Y17_05705 [Clostridiales bacterium GWF2_38_85]|nr:MAG: hypothetical protein A2Y17_05705 [Clostridiales bacterium GWF2_38_85]HBL84023.1 Stk1 family PASTA domain-containing Ser/Thr kinase [Clostridiales bacterium]
MDKSKYDVYIGKVLDGRYKILELVGIGGMAFVLRATDLVMNRTVAIKILSEEFNGDDQAEQRFINESKAVAMLSHKNIVNIYDVAIYADMKYIVMEYLDGITLKEYLTRKGKLPWKEAAFYICQILRALDHAHTKGIIHRDIKPQNIMLLRTGEIKVTDFGIAKIPNTEPLTMTDKAIGTVYYISPEQASGKTTGCYSDLYSVGVMFYEAVTGILPFVATSPVTVAMMQVNDIPKSPSDHVPELPAGVVQIILKAMEKIPENRFKSAHAMARVIEEIVQNPDYVFKPEEEPEEYNGTSTLLIDKIKPDVDEWESQEDKDYANAQRAVEQKLASTPRPVTKNNKKKVKAKKRSGMLPIVAAVTFAFILVLVGLGIAVGYQVVQIISRTPESETIEIPVLVGKEWNEQLNQELLSKKIKIKDTKKVANENETPNIIITQSISGGSTRSLTSDMKYIEITIDITMGKEEIIVPNMSITEWREAKASLEKLGLVVIKYDYFSPTVLNGYIISTEPAAGASMMSGDTIKIYVSKGQEVTKVAVPSLMNKNEAEAKRLLTEYNLTLGKVEYKTTNDVSKDGLVESQSIKEGMLVSEYSTIVDIVVYKYEPIEASQPNTEESEPQVIDVG